MSEKCPHCGAIFKVSVIGGGGFSGACLEPINCPYCKETVRQERTTGSYIEELIRAPDSQLAQYLEITDRDWEMMGAELNENTGHSDETIYSYWFEVPEGTPEEILEKTGWEIGQTVNNIPSYVVDAE